MIKGWLRQNAAPRAALPFTCVAVAAGFCVTQLEAATIEAHAFIDEVETRALSVSPAPFPATAALRADGSVEVQSALGLFEGRWAGQGDTICFFFERGPRAGETCVEITRLADGSYLSSNGTRLTPVAKAYHF